MTEDRVNNWNSLRMEAVIERIVISVDARSHQRRAIPRGSLQKLCYLCDFEHYRRHGEFLTRETYVRGRNGPVPIHFDSAMDELVTDDRLERNSDGSVRPGDAQNLSYPPWMDHRCDSPSDGLAYHVLPSLDDREIGTIDDVVRDYGGLDRTGLESVVKSDIPYVLASEGQMIDYDLVFYRDDDDGGDDDD